VFLLNHSGRSVLRKRAFRSFSAICGATLFTPVAVLPRPEYFLQRGFITAISASGKAMRASWPAGAPLFGIPSTRTGMMCSAPRSAANRRISSLTNSLARARGEHKNDQLA
jgi:hypothetical protein